MQNDRLPMDAMVCRLDWTTEYLKTQQFTSPFYPRGAEISVSADQCEPKREEILAFDGPLTKIGRVLWQNHLR